MSLQAAAIVFSTVASEFDNFIEVYDAEGEDGAIDKVIAAATAVVQAIGNIGVIAIKYKRQIRELKLFMGTEINEDNIQQLQQMLLNLMCKVAA